MTELTGKSDIRFGEAGELVTERMAALSPCGTWRYALGRRWAWDDGTVLFVMLNPSTADADIDDPTIRRCVGFAQGWGFGELLVGNLYAYRATDPRELAAVDGPVGYFDGDRNLNDVWLERLADRANYVVAAWGATAGPIPWRPERVRDVIGDRFVCLGTTKDGHPRHPLYVPADAEPVEWRSPTAFDGRAPASSAALHGKLPGEGWS